MRDTVYLWDTTEIKKLGEGLRNDGQVRKVELSRSGKLLATLVGQTIRLWESTTRQSAGQPLELDVWGDALVFSPDGKLLVVGLTDHSARVFDVSTGRMVHRLGCVGTILSLAFSPDGRILATGSDDGIVEQWDITTGQQSASPLRHEAKVSALAYSPDGKLLATALGDETLTLRLWDVMGGPPYHSLALPFQVAQGEAPLDSFTANGTVLVVSPGDGSERIWRLPVAPADLREMQVRTWVAVGAKKQPDGVTVDVQRPEWRKLREEMRLYDRRGSQASCLHPANGNDIGMTQGVELRWLSGLDAVAHNVYFGTSPGELKFLDTVKKDSYSGLTKLEKHRWYCWRVDAEKSDGTVIKGKLCSFSTGTMIGWWKFDGDTTDSSGNENHGTEINQPTYVGGIHGQALKLRGDDDYVETGKTASTLSIGGSSAKTVSAWVYTHSFNEGGIFEVGEGKLCGDFSLRTTPWDDVWRMQIWGSSGYDVDFNYSSKDKWVHFAFVYDGARTKIYADANDQPLVNVTRALNTGDSKTFKIGRWANDYFDGKIDDVRIYSYALSEDEIKEVYAGKGPGPIDRPQWVVDVIRQEPTSTEPQPDHTDTYYLPLRSEIARSHGEEELIKRRESLELMRQMLGEEHPDTAGSLNSLAWLWATCPEAKHRDSAKAIEYATKACHLTNWENARFVDTLAAAYAESGDYDSAVKWQKKAIDLLTEEEEELRAGFEERLKLYQSGKPYRENPQISSD